MVISYLKSLIAVTIMVNTRSYRGKQSGENTANVSLSDVNPEMNEIVGPCLTLLSALKTNCGDNIADPIIASVRDLTLLLNSKFSTLEEQERQIEQLLQEQAQLKQLNVELSEVRCQLTISNIELEENSSQLERDNSALKSDVKEAQQTISKLKLRLTDAVTDKNADMSNKAVNTDVRQYSNQILQTEEVPTPLKPTPVMTLQTTTATEPSLTLPVQKEDDMASRLVNLERLMNEVLSKVQHIGPNFSSAPHSVSASQHIIQKKNTQKSKDKQKMPDRPSTSQPPLNQNINTSSQQSAILIDFESELSPENLNQGVPKKTSECRPPSRNKKVVIVADSQGKDLTRHMTRLLGSNSSCDVFSIIRPGSDLKFVTRDLAQIVKAESLNKDDFLVVIGGTNDVTKRGGYQPSEFNEGIANVSGVAAQTNVIVPDIPLRFDLPISSNSIVRSMNIALKNELNKTEASFLQRKPGKSDMTRHGLHYSPLGKEHLAKDIVDIIKNKPFLG